MRHTAIHKLFILCLLCLTTAILSGCHSSRKVTVRGDSAYASTKLPRSKTRQASGATGSLLREAESWLGTPYKYGGTDRDGVDCSGFVLRVYKDALGISLPRNSRAQRDFCPWTDMASLYPGDLLFFSSDTERDHVTHVGIFVGDNQMIHASTSRGVIVTDITTAYYKRNYMGGGIVEQYHAMEGVPAASKKRKKPAQEVPSTPDEIHISRLESPTGFTLTPVDGLPQRISNNVATEATSVKSAQKTADKPQKTSDKSLKAEAKPKKSDKPQKTEKGHNAGNPSKNIPVNASPEDARAVVLGTLSEQPLSTRQ